MVPKKSQPQPKPSILVEPKVEPKKIVVDDIEAEVIKPASVEEVKTRKGYIVIQQVQGSDEWQIKQTSVARKPDSLIQSIPPNCPNALVVELDLPFKV